MSAPLRIAGHRDAHAVATNAVLLSFFERFGTLPRRGDRLGGLIRSSGFNSSATSNLSSASRSTMPTSNFWSVRTI
jgi:hypothetical protein